MSVFGVILVGIFQHSNWTLRDTPYLSIFIPNAGEIWTRITSNTDTFYAVMDTAIALEMKSGTQFN